MDSVGSARLVRLLFKDSFSVQTGPLALVFARPDVLLVGAIAVVCLGAFLVYCWAERQRCIRLFVQPKLLGELTVGVSAGRQQLRLLLFVLAVASLFCALARPWHGYGPVRSEVFTREWVLLFDVSASMEAQDVGLPRLELAKQMANELIKEACDGLVGLVCFAGDAGVISPLCGDRHTVLELIEGIRGGLGLRPGTELGIGLEAAASLLGTRSGTDRAIFVFTDGETFDTDLYRAIKVIQALGINLFIAGVGTPEGATLQVPEGNGVRIVQTRLREDLLLDLAMATGGVYLRVSHPEQISAAVGQWLQKLANRGPGLVVFRPYREQFQWFVGIALVLLALEMVLPDRRRRLSRPLGSARSTGNQEFRAEYAHWAMVITLAIQTCCDPVFAGDPGRVALEEGAYQEAFEYYQKQLERRPNNLAIMYNLGIAAFRVGKLEMAADLFYSCTESRDVKLAGSAFYNLGNVLFEVGRSNEEPELKRFFWQKAIEAYKEALRRLPNDQDTLWNLNVVRAHLGQLEDRPTRQAAANERTAYQQPVKSEVLMRGATHHNLSVRSGDAASSCRGFEEPRSERDARLIARQALQGVRLWKPFRHVASSVAEADNPNRPTW